MTSASNQVEANTESEVLGTKAKNASLEVFEVVLSSILDQLAAMEPEVIIKLRHSVCAQVSLGLSSLVERQRLNSWIMGYTDNLKVDISVKDMQYCIHHTYMIACDYFGPGKADLVLSNAIKESDALPAAKVFEPRKLL